MTQDIRGLSLTQPWASLMMLGAKAIETRSWTTGYRGLVAIHASLGFPRACQGMCATEPFYSALSPLGVYVNPKESCGKILAVGTLKHVRSTNDTPLPVIPGTTEYAFGDYSPGRYAWVFSDVVPLRNPIPCKGSLGLWKLPDDVREKVMEQI